MLSEMIEPQGLLSNAIAAMSGEHWGRRDAEIIVAACDITPERHWSLSFCPQDRCFYVAIDGHERLRTDSPQIACAYFTTRRPH